MRSRRQKYRIKQFIQTVVGPILFFGAIVFSFWLNGGYRYQKQTEEFKSPFLVRAMEVNNYEKN